MPHFREDTPFTATCFITVQCCTSLRTMYHSPAFQRSPTEEDDRLRRESLKGSNIQQQHHTHYDGRSPNAQLLSYSPTNGSHPQLSYNAYPSRPSTATNIPISSTVSQSPRLGPPPSPTTNGLSHINKSSYIPREAGSSTYYDPTSEHRDGPMNWNHPGYASRSPVQVRR